MKRYDLAGEVLQFGSKQFWVCLLKNGFDLWVSYDTVVAIVDHNEKIVLEGAYARGFSCTTTKQVNQAYGVYTHGYYETYAYDSDEYIDYSIKHKLNPADCYCPWDALNRAHLTSYRLADILG